MTEQRTIDAPLLGAVLGYAECYMVELDYWYGMAKAGNGGSINSLYSSTICYDFDYEPDRALKEFREEIEELKKTIKEAKEALLIGEKEL